jgi:hypothetical protein
MTLYLAGYHDSFKIKLDELREQPCFAPGIIYLIELDVNTTKDLFKSINEELKNSSTIKSELESRLHSLGFDHTVSANISDLIDLEPEAIIPCATKTRAEPGFYGSKRDKEILFIVNALTSILKKDVTFFGGSKHAKYMANELEHPHKILYDFRDEQSSYNPILKRKLKMTL